MNRLPLRLFFRWFAFALPLLSITYLVRFRVAGLPSTLLEVLLWVFVVGVFFVTKDMGMARAHQLLRAWRWPIVAWVLATLIAVFASPSLWTGIGLWRAYVLEPLLVLIAVCAILDQPGDRKRMEQGMMVAASVVSIWAIVGYLGNWGIPHPWNIAIRAGRRAVGPFGFPNGVALFVTPIGALVVGRLANMFAEQKMNVKRAWKEYALPFVSFFLIAAALIAARSQGGMGAFAIAIVLSLLGLRKGRWLVFVGAILSILGLILVPGVRSALVREVSFQGWSGKVRLFIWRETWAMLKDHWFFGAGFGGYPKVFDAYHKARFIEIFQYPHTLLFNFWTETGLLGVLVFVGIVVTWFKNAVRSVRAQFAEGSTARYLSKLVLIAPLIAMLVHGLVDVPYFKNDLALLFWLFAWLVIAAQDESPKLAWGEKD
jgi:O-antigen ligase